MTIYQYQDVVLRNFDSAKGHGTSIKGQLVGLIRNNLFSKLIANDTPMLKFSNIILNTSGWD